MANEPNAQESRRGGADSAARAPSSSRPQCSAGCCAHFDERKDVQNIELMILAGFCRNCLSKWFVEAARERGLSVDLDAARERVYGMPYSQWKERHQQPATPEQLRRFEASGEARAATVTGCGTWRGQ